MIDYTPKKKPEYKPFGEKYGKAKPKVNTSPVMPMSEPPRAGSNLRQHPSRVTPGGSTAARPNLAYTGSSMIGVATMHKSNGVPIFNDTHAKEVSSMRR